MVFRKTSLFLATLLISTPIFARAQGACTNGDVRREALLPLGLQNRLLAHKQAADNFELDAPSDVSADVVMLRKTLAVVTQAFFRCEAGNDTRPDSLQTRLAKLLHANQPEEPLRHAPDGSIIEPIDGIYGSKLRVDIEPLTGLPSSVAVKLTFGIECGDDNLLLIYTWAENKWHQRLSWYANKYTKPSDAFGDLYLYSSLPENRIVVAHGHPWCSSVHSGLNLDLIQMATDSSSQHVLDHITHGYVRDGEPSIRHTNDGIQLDVEVESIDSSVIYHPGVLRYRTTSRKFELLPVARNAKEFADAWLQEPWTTVASWSAPRCTRSSA